MRKLLIVFLSTSAACSGDPPREAPASCVPGAVIECPCLGGGRGVQTCRSDGTFDACVCAVDAWVEAADTADTATPDTAVADSFSDSTADVAETLAKCPSDAGCIIHAPITTRSVTLSGLTFTICPDGPKATAPLECILEIDLGNANWTHFSDTGVGQVSGVVPMRITRLPVRTDAAMSTAIWEMRTVPGSTWVGATMQVVMSAPAARPRPGCDSATMTSTDINSFAINSNLRGFSPIPEFKAALAEIIVSEADKALRDATSAMTCRSP